MIEPKNIYFYCRRIGLPDSLDKNHFLIYTLFTSEFYPIQIFL